MAATLSEDPRLTVEQVRGGLGELSVHVDGVRAYRSNPFWYPRSETVLGAVREWLAR